jgi:exopolysaccharide biosynthesis protein
MEERKKKAAHVKKKHMSVAALVALDILAIGVGLIVFALFHHVLFYAGILRGEESTPVVLTTLAPQPTPTPVPTPAQSEPQETDAPPEESAEPEPVRVYSGMWGEKFADKFTDGEVIKTENSYQSANVNVTFRRIEENGVIYHIADIYISDLRYLTSAFARGDFNAGIDDMVTIARDANAVVALSGDHYYGSAGVVVRNGVSYRETRFQDVCVLLSDGTMVTMTNAELDLDELRKAGPYQVWSFGPELLDDEGHAMTRFNSVVLRRNPRSAIGYFEPGHYCFVEVDGRIAESRGMEMAELSQLFESLGCRSAYNLDGGQSAGIVWQGEQISYRYNRYISDMICITDDAPQGEG